MVRSVQEEGREGGWHGRLTRGAPLAVLLAVVLLLAYRLLPVLELVAVAMLAALVLRSVVNWLCGFGLKPWLSILVLLGVLVAFGAFLWLVVVPNLLSEATSLAALVPGYLNDLEGLAQRLSGTAGPIPDLSQLSDRIRGAVIRLVDSIPVLLLGLGQLALEAFATLILALYLAFDLEPLIRGSLRLLVPQRRRGEARRLLLALETRLRGWIVGTGLAMLFVGGGAGLGLWLLGVPLPLTFGLLAGLLDVVPYFGSVLGALLPALVALTVSPVKALLVLVLFLILNQLEAHVVQPLVMGHEVRLHPVVVILAFLFMGRLLGLAGVLLAVPIAVVLATLLEELPPEEPAEKEPEEEPVPGASRG